MQGLPTRDGEKRMMTGDLNTPSGLGAHRKTWLETAVHPGDDISYLDSASRRKAENRRTFPLNKLLDGEPRSGLRIVHERARDQTFPDSRPGCNDDQVRLLEASGLRIEIVEAARHAGKDGLILVDLLDLIPRRLQNVFERDEVLRDAALGDVEDHAFRGIERLARGRRKSATRTMALRSSINDPSTEASASKLWGGTRPPAAGGAGARLRSTVKPR